MLPRAVIILLCLVLGGAGVWAGNRYFDDAAGLLSTGSVSLMMKHHEEGNKLARGSFSMASGLLAFSIPLSALLAGRFRSRGDYLQPFAVALTVGFIASIAALLYYRNEMSSVGPKFGEMFALVHDSKKEIALNPLTRSVLFGTALSLVAGLARGVFSPASGKK